jgi:hypothetical protein
VSHKPDNSADDYIAVFADREDGVVLGDYYEWGMAIMRRGCRVIAWCTSTVLAQSRL